MQRCLPGAEACGPAGEDEPAAFGGEDCAGGCRGRAGERRWRGVADVGELLGLGEGVWFWLGEEGGPFL